MSCIWKAIKLDFRTVEKLSVIKVVKLNCLIKFVWETFCRPLIIWLICLSIIRTTSTYQCWLICRHLFDWFLWSFYAFNYYLCTLATWNFWLILFLNGNFHWNFFQANESQLVRYANPVDDCCSVLGLRFRMQTRHLQMQELKLTCRATHHRTVASYSRQMSIRTISAAAAADVRLSDSESRSTSDNVDRRLWLVQTTNNSSSAMLSWNLFGYDLIELGLWICGCFFYLRFSWQPCSWHEERTDTSWSSGRVLALLVKMLMNQISGETEEIVEKVEIFSFYFFNPMKLFRNLLNRKKMYIFISKRHCTDLPSYTRTPSVNMSNVIWDLTKTTNLTKNAY